MISTASVAYLASLMCDDFILPVELDKNPMIWNTSKHFHKTFVKAGEYSLQFGLNENLGLDANGLGRVHKEGAPSAICLSMPCPLVTGYLGFGDFHSENGLIVVLEQKLANFDTVFFGEEYKEYKEIDNET